MPSFTIQFEAEAVEVKIPESLSQERLEKSQKWKDWVTQLEKSMSLTKKECHPFCEDGYKLNGIEVISYAQWGHPSELQFLKVHADVQYTDRKTKKIESAPGLMFMRGPSVAVLVVLVPKVPEYEAERYVLLTRQPRVAVGSLDFVELPAGMIEQEDQEGPKQKKKCFAGRAAKEIEEEVGIKIPADQMTNLTELAAQCLSENSTEGLQNAMYPSAGGCDEYIQIFFHEREVDREDLNKWKAGKGGGKANEGENIRSKVVALQDLWKEGLRDGKALAAVALYEGLRREGKLKSRFEPKPVSQAA